MLLEVRTVIILGQGRWRGLGVWGLLHGSGLLWKALHLGYMVSDTEKEKENPKRTGPSRPPPSVWHWAWAAGTQTSARKKGASVLRSHNPLGLCCHCETTCLWRKMDCPRWVREIKPKQCPCRVEVS